MLRAKLFIQKLTTSGAFTGFAIFLDRKIPQLVFHPLPPSLRIWCCVGSVVAKRLPVPVVHWSAHSPDPVSTRIPLSRDITPGSTECRRALKIRRQHADRLRGVLVDSACLSAHASDQRGHLPHRVIWASRRVGLALAVSGVCALNSWVAVYPL